MAKTDEFLTVSAAAEMLRVAPNTLRNWDRDGKIVVYRDPSSRYRLFKRADLEAILAEIEQSGQYPTGWAARRKPR